MRRKIAIGGFVLLVGCAAFQSSPVPQATQQEIECVTNQLLAGDTSVPAIAAACSVQETSFFMGLVAWLAQELLSAGRINAAQVATVNSSISLEKGCK